MAFTPRCAQERTDPRSIDGAARERVGPVASPRHRPAPGHRSACFSAPRCAPQPLPRSIDMFSSLIAPAVLSLMATSQGNQADDDAKAVVSLFGPLKVSLEATPKEENIDQRVGSLEVLASQLLEPPVGPQR